MSSKDLTLREIAGAKGRGGNAAGDDAKFMRDEGKAMVKTAQDTTWGPMWYGADKQSKGRSKRRGKRGGK